MILCSECGEQNEDGTVFCTRCGVFLEWEAEHVPTGNPTGNPAPSASAPAASPAVVGHTPAAARSWPPPDVPAATSTQPSTPQPSAGQPSAGQPFTPQPLAAQPLAGQPSALQPSARQPTVVKKRTVRRSKPAIVVPTGSLICGACGMPNESTRRFCAKCGFSLAEAKVVRKTAWWRRLLGREHVYAAGTRRRVGTGRRRMKGTGRILVVLGLLAGGGVLAGPQRGLVTSAFGKVQDMFRDPVQVRVVDPKTSGSFGRQGAHLAFDGATNTYWAAPKTGRGSSKAPYIGASFPKTVDLTAIIIFTGISTRTPVFAAGPRAVELEVSVIPESGDPVVTKLTLEERPGRQDFDLKVPNAKAIQIAILKTTGPTKTLATALTEVEFHATR